MKRLLPLLLCLLTACAMSACAGNGAAANDSATPAAAAAPAPAQAGASAQIAPTPAPTTNEPATAPPRPIDAPAPGKPAPRMSKPLPPEVARDPAPVSKGAVDTSCRTSADCAVKNVGSCCGAQPACVNVNSPTNPDAVRAACAKDGRVGVCGFRPIAGCECVKGQCQPDGTLELTN